MATADAVIRALGLEPHPKEGGYFRETYRASESYRSPRHGGDRSVSTAIYYLLTPTTISALHKLASDEIFHFYAGDPVRMLQLGTFGGREFVLGPDVLAGQHPQLLVPHGTWQGSLLEPGGTFALLGCTVAPGFDYVDYEHGRRDDLTARHPAHAELIRKLTLEG